MVRISVVPGDGIGPEMTGACIDVLKRLPVDLDFEYAEAGQSCFEAHGTYLPYETVEAVKKSGACLMGPVNPPDENSEHEHPAMKLRKDLGLFANVRHIKSFSPRINPRPLDVVIVRENTEGLYTMIEKDDDGIVVTDRIVTKNGCDRIIQFAFDYAVNYGRKRVSCVHKASVLRRSDGLFRELFYFKAFSYASRRFGLEVEDYLVDKTALMLVKQPEKFDVIVTLNMYGDILSEEAAGLAGGRGVVPSGHIGDKYAVFGPMHGPHTELEGKGVYNPTASILAGAMMLRYVGMREAARAIESAITEVFKRNVFTIDVGGTFGTQHFLDEVHKELDRSVKQ